MRFPILLSLCTLALFASCSGAPTQSVNIQALRSVEINGGSVNLNQAFSQNKYVTLVFWQHWCAPCLAEAPHVQSAFENYSDQVAFFGVVSGPDQSEADKDLRFTIKNLGLTYPQVRDRDGSWSASLQISSTPTVVVFSPQGKQIFRGHELPDWNRILN